MPFIVAAKPVHVQCTRDSRHKKKDTLPSISAAKRARRVAELVSNAYMRGYAFAMHLSCHLDYASRLSARRSRDLSLTEQDAVNWGRDSLGACQPGCVAIAGRLRPAIMRHGLRHACAGTPLSWRMAHGDMI